MSGAYFYLVDHGYVPGEGFSNTKRIGVFATRAAAAAAILQVKDAPGFCDHPKGFTIQRKRVSLPAGMAKSEIKELFQPWHEFYDEEEDCDIVAEGPFFAREADAWEALNTMRRELDLTEYQDCFDVGGCIIGQVCWAEGFVPFDA